jgi:N-acetylmuramoyl-L-alanine amidase
MATPTVANAATISQVNTWVNSNVNHQFSNHGGSACVALFNAYSENLLGNPFLAVSYASQIYGSAPTTKWTQKSASTTPQKGDVAVWNGNAGGGAGHVAVVLENMSSTTVRVFHQNWNGAAAHKEVVSKSNIQGYLRPTNLS